MPFVAIIFCCVVAAVIYGILHDLVTAHVCVEYFTIAHPPIFNTDDPIVLAFGWGFLATWWVGFILGSFLAMCARIGKRSKRDVKSLIRPVMMLFAIAYIGAMISGMVGYVLARYDVIFLVGPYAKLIAPDRHHRFLFDMWAHLASYGIGIVGGIIICIRVAISRRQD